MFSVNCRGHQNTHGFYFLAGSLAQPSLVYPVLETSAELGETTRATLELKLLFLVIVATNLAAVIPLCDITMGPRPDMTTEVLFIYYIKSMKKFVSFKVQY